MRNYLMGLQPTTGMTGQLYNKWIGFIVEALSCYDKERDLWVHLPEIGGYYDQDDFLMTIWECVRMSFKQLRNDETIISWNKSVIETRSKHKMRTK